MTDTVVFDSEKALGSGISGLGRERLLRLAAELCRYSGNAGHGCAIRPDNICLDDCGRASVGPYRIAERGEWSREELEYMPPELFWHGVSDARSDVYSIGLILFSGMNGGKPPFAEAEDDEKRAEAVSRRMGAETVKAPEGCDAELADVIEKALAFRAEDRFDDASALLTALNDLLHENGDTADIPTAKPQKKYAQLIRGVIMAAALAAFVLASSWLSGYIGRAIPDDGSADDAPAPTVISDIT